MSQLLPPKKEVALALLECSNVDVYLDPRAKGVVVPPQFRKEPRLILKIGLNMPVPIHDLRLDEESMSCTLSFNRSPFYCVVPWTSVFAMVGEDGRGMVWPDDVPQELAVKVVPAESSAASSPRPSIDGEDGEDVAPSRSEVASSRRGGRGSKLADPSSLSSPSSTREAAFDREPRGGVKKRKKKEVPLRPVLVAVPPIAAASAALAPSSAQSLEAEARAARSAEAKAAEGETPAGRRSSRRATPAERAAAESAEPRAEPREGGPPAPSPPQRRAGSQGSQGMRIPPPAQRRPEGARPKRELPPYLRVVK